MSADNNLNDPLIYVRGLHFAATIAATGVVWFIAFIGEPAFRNAKQDTGVTKLVRNRLAWIAWIGLLAAVLSGIPWLVLTAESMSGQPLSELSSQGVLWTVLSQTDFGRDWLLRFVMACVLGALFVRFLSAEGMRSLWLKAVTVILAAALVGSLAWAGHAIGGRGVEGLLHPAADVLHLIAAAAWAGALVPLALLLTMTRVDAASLTAARTATLRFSRLGIVSVATILFTGIVNTCYLAGSIPALVGTDYGHLLLIKIALFLGMVGIAGINRLRLTPRLIQNADVLAAQNARRQLSCNATVEAIMSAAIIAIVAVLGTLPPASHAHHHAASGAIPADATFQHIHGESGMADVMIEPGRVGNANATIRLWNNDLETLDAREVTVTLTAPTAGKPTTRVASQDSDGAWHVVGIELTEPGNWMVTVRAVLSSGGRLDLEAPIVINAN
jgi:putative copper resistance protein D